MIKKHSLYIIIFSIGVLTIGGVFLASIVKNNQPSQAQNSSDEDIAILAKEIENNSQKVEAYINLSNMYAQKIRDTADGSYYAKIDDLMNAAEKIDPMNADIPATRAGVELGRHHFREAKVLAEKALSLNSRKDLYYGLLGDAQLELGEYEEAVESFQKMVNIRPSFNSYTRIAYVRELYGDILGAQESLRQALDVGSTFPENIAWTYVELGKLAMHTDLAAAEKNFNDALLHVPDYPNALEGLGKIAFFKGDAVGAQAYFQKAYDTIALAQYSIDLGDLETKKNNVTQASQYYTLAQLSFDASRTSGTNTDLEEALFLAGHNLELPHALELAERAYKDRPNIYAADYLSWAYLKNGNAAQAATYTKEALRLGENDPLILFHQGMVAYQNGNKADAKKYLAKALEINPYFSIIHVSEAQNLLKNL